MDDDVAARAQGSLDRGDDAVSPAPRPLNASMIDGYFQTRDSNAGFSIVGADKKRSRIVLTQAARFVYPGNANMSFFGIPEKFLNGQV
ncbi:MAG: hypothetical protein ING44_12930 [Telmatospirillum sp.]|nr:hypothetical protein [Telmatospirillum sp.]